MGKFLMSVPAILIDYKKKQKQSFGLDRPGDLKSKLIKAYQWKFLFYFFC